MGRPDQDAAERVFTGGEEGLGFSSCRLGGENTHAATGNTISRQVDRRDQQTGWPVGPP